MQLRKSYLGIGAILGVILLCGILLLVPSINKRMAYYLEQIQIKLEYAFNPPEEAVFVPNEQVATIVYATLYPTYDVLTQTAISAQTSQTPTVGVVDTPTPTVPPAAATPLPASVSLDGVRYEDQHGLWNYCAPANLSMALSYWGWEGDRLDTGKYLKPLDDDKNVMPYEMENYVLDETSYGVVYRYGGTLHLLKQFLISGFPVLLETGVDIRGVTTGTISWTGHYILLTGYDDTNQIFITQDSYYSADYPVIYQTLLKEWRSFNYVFMVIYPWDRQDEVTTILGDKYVDLITSAQTALEIATDEVQTLSGQNLFFAKFNQGSSYVWMQDYISAAAKYDEAFTYYPSITESDRPWRVMWYQTGPYYAYYYTGRYEDVISLANQTLDIHDPYLEESYYWRARAELALGDEDGARQDLEEALKIHDGFIPAVELLESLGG